MAKVEEYGDIRHMIAGIDSEEAEAQLKWWAIAMADAEKTAQECYADAASATKPSDYIAATSRADLHKKRAELYEKMLLRCMAPMELGALLLWALQQPGLKANTEGLESDQEA